LVLDDKEQTWFLVKAETVQEAIENARNYGFNPYYVVEEKLATKVWEEEILYEKHLLTRKRRRKTK